MTDAINVWDDVPDWGGIGARRRRLPVRDHERGSVGTMLFSNQPAPPNLKNLVGRIAPRPVLFIYGDHDQANVRDLTPDYYAAAGAPKALWEVPGASNTGGIDARPRQYERRVIAFFDHALLGQQRG